MRLKKAVFGWGALGKHPQVLRVLLFSAQYSHITPSADSLDSSSFILPWGLEEQSLGPVPVLNGLGMQSRPEKAWGFLSMCTDTRGTENPMVWENKQTKACFTHISAKENMQIRGSCT